MKSFIRTQAKGIKGQSTSNSKLCICVAYLQISSIAVSDDLSIHPQRNEICSIEKNQELFPLTRLLKNFNCQVGKKLKCAEIYYPPSSFCISQNVKKCSCKCKQETE